MVSYSDVNGDGFIDIVVQVSTQALELTSSDVKANLQGQLVNGAIYGVPTTSNITVSGLVSLRASMRFLRYLIQYKEMILKKAEFTE